MALYSGNMALRGMLRCSVARSGLGLELARVPRATRAHFSAPSSPPRPTSAWPRLSSTFRSSSEQGQARSGSTSSVGIFSTSLGLSLGIFGFFQSQKSLSLESSTAAPTPAPQSPPPSSTTPPAPKDLPQSQVNPYNLGFGTVCGICAGVFIKKGAKFIAFLLGGAFVLLQYLNSQGLVRVNWSALSKRYESTLDSAASTNPRAVAADNASSGMTESVTSQRGWKDSRAARLWNRFVHFLTADFPTRGTFLAGLALGLRLG